MIVFIGGQDSGNQGGGDEHSSASNKAVSNKSSSSSDNNSSGLRRQPHGLVRRDTKRMNRQNLSSGSGKGSSSGGNNSDMEKHHRVGLSLTEKRPSITAEELTPIVLNQLQTTSKMKEESRKLRRGSRSSTSSTPASIVIDKPVNAIANQLDSGSESCGEEARLRTAEAFMSGIQSAIQSDAQNLGVCGAAGLSAELVGEVNSVLGKLMQSLNKNDPSLIPLIVTLQASLKANKQNIDSNKIEEHQHSNVQAKEVALSEFSTGNDDPFFPFDGDPDNSSKIPWKIRAARKRAMKHHTTGMTKDEFAKIKQSLMQSQANCEFI